MPLLRTVLFARGENVSQIKGRSCNRKAKSARWRFHTFRSRTPARLLGPPLWPVLDWSRGVSPERIGERGPRWREAQGSLAENVASADRVRARVSKMRILSLFS